MPGGRDRHIADAISAVIVRHFASIGLNHFDKIAIGDALGRPTAVFSQFSDRCDAVVTRGGSAADCVRRETIAATTERELLGCVAPAIDETGGDTPRVLLRARRFGRAVSDEMKLAAARALSALVTPGELSAEYIIASVFNKVVAP